MRAARPLLLTAAVLTTSAGACEADATVRNMQTGDTVPITIEIGDIETRVGENDSFHPNNTHENIGRIAIND